jgi:hypothetical protein
LMIFSFLHNHDRSDVMMMTTANGIHRIKRPVSPELFCREACSR